MELENALRKMFSRSSCAKDLHLKTTLECRVGSQQKAHEAFYTRFNLWNILKLRRLDASMTCHG